MTVILTPKICLRKIEILAKNFWGKIELLGKN